LLEKRQAHQFGTEAQEGRKTPVATKECYSKRGACSKRQKGLTPSLPLHEDG
jgi:hypothetical protein